MMNTRAPWILALGLVIGLAGCASVAQTTKEQDRAVTDTESFIAYLNDEGVGTDEVGFITEPHFEARGKAFRLMGSSLLHVYEYDSVNAAELDVDKVNLSQLSPRRQPQVYQRGKLLVVFFGRNSGLQITLTNVLGTPIA